MNNPSFNDTPSDKFKVPDLISGVLGYKIMRLREGGSNFSKEPPSLHSATRNYQWNLANVNIFTCECARYRSTYLSAIANGFWLPVDERDEDFEPCKKPMEDGSCGLYAWYDVDVHDRHYYFGGQRGKQVYAAIKSYGQVQVHKDGTRAEKARIICIYSPFDIIKKGDRIHKYFEKYTNVIVTFSEKEFNSVVKASGAVKIPDHMIPDWESNGI